MAYNRETFFSKYRENFGRLKPGQVAALEFLLARLEDDSHFGAVPQLAYILATIKHETADTFEPIDEYGGASYFNKRYGPGTRVGKTLGNTEPGDGDRFHGRGYPQTTGRKNYTLLGKRLGVDLVGNPARATEPDIAYKMMSLAMHEGLYTGKKLSDYVHGSKKDYFNARRVINGTDRAQHIADIAANFEECLTAAATPAAAPVVPVDAVGLPPSGAATADTAGAATPGPQTVVESAGTVNVEAAVQPVKGGGKDDAPIPVTEQWWEKTKSIPAKIYGLLTGGVTLGVATISEWMGFVKSNAGLVLVLVAIGVIVVIGLFLMHMRYQRNRETQRQKFELEKMKLTIASDPTKINVS